MEDIKKTVDVAEEVTKGTDEEVAVEETQVEEQKAPIEFDYDKLAEIVNGKQTETEDRVLGGYFKKQGLSPEEMAQAIATFKEQRAQLVPDIGAIQQQANDNLMRALNSEAQNKAMLLASELGVDVKAMPYLVKMANIDEVISNGAVDESKLRSTLEEIISAMPQLKQATVQGGFQVVGADTTKNAQTADDGELERAFGIKK